MLHWRVCITQSWCAQTEQLDHTQRRDFSDDWNLTSLRKWENDFLGWHLFSFPCLLVNKVQVDNKYTLSNFIMIYFLKDVQKQSQTSQLTQNSSTRLLCFSPEQPGQSSPLMGQQRHLSEHHRDAVTEGHRHIQHMFKKQLRKTT